MNSTCPNDVNKVNFIFNATYIDSLIGNAEHDVKHILCVIGNTYYGCPSYPKYVEQWFDLYSNDSTILNLSDKSLSIVCFIENLIENYLEVYNNIKTNKNFNSDKSLTFLKNCIRVFAIHKSWDSKSNNPMIEYINYTDEFTERYQKVNEELFNLRNELSKKNEDIKGLAQECNELYIENQEINIAIDLKDKEILELKNKRSNYTLSNLHYQKEINELKEKNNKLKQELIHETNYKRCLIHTVSIYEQNYKNLLDNFNKSSNHLLNELTTPFTLVGKI